MEAEAEEEEEETEAEAEEEAEAEAEAEAEEEEEEEEVVEVNFKLVLPHIFLQIIIPETKGINLEDFLRASYGVWRRLSMQSQWFWVSEVLGWR